MTILKKVILLSTLTAIGNSVSFGHDARFFRSPDETYLSPNEARNLSPEEARRIAEIWEKQELAKLEQEKADLELAKILSEQDGYGDYQAIQRAEEKRIEKERAEAEERRKKQLEEENFKIAQRLQDFYNTEYNLLRHNEQLNQQRAKQLEAQLKEEEQKRLKQEEEDLKFALQLQAEEEAQNQIMAPVHPVILPDAPKIQQKEDDLTILKRRFEQMKLDEGDDAYYDPIKLNNDDLYYHVDGQFYKVIENDSRIVGEIIKTAPHTDEGRLVAVLKDGRYKYKNQIIAILKSLGLWDGLI